MTVNTLTHATKKLVWKNISFFVATTLVGVIGTPFYLSRYGLSPSEIALFGFYLMATGLSITVGYHRLFAHRTYEAHPLIQFLLLFFGAAAFEQPALDWASQHRNHHRYVDTDQDPYSIKKGFFYAHIGWLIFWKHRLNYDNVKDLQRNPLLMHQFRYYQWWAVGAGILLPIAIGALTGHALGALILSVCARITLVYHSTFCINSVCHMFGKATYDIHATAKDHWAVALVTYGEGYHNFHHRFPGDYRNGVLWYQWDPSKWMIATLEKIGFARNLRKISRFRILEAKIAADRQRVHDSLRDIILPHPHGLNRLQETLEARYLRLRESLLRWESAVKNIDLQHSAAVRVKAARFRFQRAHRRWEEIQQTLLQFKPLLRVAPAYY